MAFCSLSNTFGEPNKGVHAVRVFDIAVVDVVLSFVLAYIVQKIGNYQSYWVVLICVFLVGILCHWLFCVNTTVNKFLFGKTGDNKTIE